MHINQYTSSKTEYIVVFVVAVVVVRAVTINTTTTTTITTPTTTNTKHVPEYQSLDYHIYSYTAQIP